MRHSVAELASFAREHVASKDIDPVYPVARYLQRTFGAERAIWHTFVYVAYYNIASAETAFDQVFEWLFVPESFHPPLPEETMRLPTGTERRNLRGGQPMRTHLTSLRDKARQYGSLQDWLAVPAEGNDEGERELNWNYLDGVLQDVWGNGRWASYKTREVLWKVNDFPLQAPDTGMANSSGPRDGLAVVYPHVAQLRGNAPATIQMLEKTAWHLRDEVAAAHDVDLAIEELETVLCDFHALVEGRYYVGHDIDLMLEQLWHPSVSAEARERILEARAATLPHAYLSELHGRKAGVDAVRKRAYRDLGWLLTR